MGAELHLHNRVPLFFPSCRSSNPSSWPSPTTSWRTETLGRSWLWGKKQLFFFQQRKMNHWHDVSDSFSKPFCPQGSTPSRRSQDAARSPSTKTCCRIWPSTKPTKTRVSDSLAFTPSLLTHVWVQLCVLSTVTLRCDDVCQRFDPAVSES